jgi:hypothetical protein
MYIRFEKSSTFEAFPQKLTKEGWDYFVDLTQAETELEIARAFCIELYSKKMGPLRETFNVNYFNDMMTEFFGDHADEELQIAVLGARSLWELGGNKSAEFIELLLTAHRHGAFAHVRRRKLPNIDDVDAVVNGKINLVFVT